MFRRRQRLFVEMEQMASRPFSQVNIDFKKLSPHSVLLETLLLRLQVLVEIDSKGREYNEIPMVLDSSTVAKKKKKDSPSPIALEPCVGNKAAVLSLLVRMPTGELKNRASGHGTVKTSSSLTGVENFNI